MRRLCLLLALIWFAGSQPASAMLIPMPHTVSSLASCYQDETIYTPASSNTPAVVAHSFVGRGKEVAFRTCRDEDGNIHYFVRKPRPNRGGVCHVVEDELFPATASEFVIVDVLYGGMNPDWYFDLHGWRHVPPKPWTAMGYRAAHRSLVQVMAENSACPPPGDAGYIAATGTDGLIKTFFLRWRAVISSPDSFDRAFASVPELSTFDSAPVSPDHVRRGLRTAVFDRHEQVTLIMCDEQELGEQGGCYAYVGVFSILFDVTDRGLEIMGIRENPLA